MLKHAEELPNLDAPPIFEVVCGIGFKKLRGIDSYSVGQYWESRKREFPQRESKPPFFRNPGVFPQSMVVDIPQSNTWMISTDQSRVLQVQDDRLHLNWRRLSPEDSKPYPRFHTRESQGLLDQFLSEVNQFSDYIADKPEIGGPINLAEVSLAKIDHLMNGTHWASHEDLFDLLPILRNYTTLEEQTDPMEQFSLSFNENNSKYSCTTNIVPGMYNSATSGVIKMVRIETNIFIRETELSNIRPALEVADGHIDAIFMNLIPMKEILSRFGISKGEDQ